MPSKSQSAMNISPAQNHRGKTPEPGSGARLGNHFLVASILTRWLTGCFCLELWPSSNAPWLPPQFCPRCGTHFASGFLTGIAADFRPLTFAHRAFCAAAIFAFQRRSSFFSERHRFDPVLTLPEIRSSSFWSDRFCP